MPTVTLPDNTEIEFPDSMSEADITGVIEKEYPKFKAPSQPDQPKGSLSDFTNATDAGLTETSPLTPDQPAQVRSSLRQSSLPSEQSMIQSQVPKGDVAAPIGEAPATVPRFGQPGTLTRGVSNVASGLLEWAMNKPEEAFATLTPLAPAIAIRYGPEMAKQWGEKLIEGLKGDRESLGEAITMAALVGGPTGLKKAMDRSIVEGKPAMEPPSPQETALTATLPKEGAETRSVLTGEKGNVEPPLGVDVAATLPASAEAAKALGVIEPKTEGEPNASKIEETAALHGDVLRPAQEGQSAEALPFNEGQPGVRTEGEVAAETLPPDSTSGTEVTPTAGGDFVPSLTAVKNEMVDRQRGERGQPPLMDPMRKSDTELWDTAMKRIEADPALPERLTSELLDNPRPMTDEETVILDRHMVDIKNDLDRSLWEGIKAGDAAEKAREDMRQATDANSREAARVRESDALEKAAQHEKDASEIGARLDRVEQAIGRESERGTGGAGTLMGRAFRARQLLMREDYSYAGLQRKMRAAKGFKSLSSDELALARKTAEEFKAKNDALEERLKEQTKIAEKAQAARELAEMRTAAAKAEAAVTGKVKAVVRKVGDFLDKRADAARERLRGKVLSLSPGDLADIVEIAASNLYHIGEDVARWSAKMVEEFGEGIKPHLEEVLKAARAKLDESIKSVAGAEEPKKGKRTFKTKEIASAKETIANRIRRRIKDYEERISRGDYRTNKRVAPPMDKETLKLQFELEQVKKRFHEGVVEAQMKRRTRPEKFFGGAVEGVNAMRAILTSADLSAVLRQGGLIGMAHPIRAARSIIPMLKAMVSEKGAFAVEQNIRGRENYPLYRASKLYLAEHGFQLSKMEEQYMSRLATKIPLVGSIVKGSERAYITFLNKLRADSFDAMKSTLGHGPEGTISMPEARVISNFINVMTGRGTLSIKDSSAAALSAAFFAPRFVASRFQVLGLQPLYHGIFTGKAPIGGTKSARALVAYEYARMLTGMAAVYGLGVASGASIETDTNSSDFGKLKFGNTRIDLMAGLIQNTVLLSKIITGEKKNLRTGKTQPLRGKVPYGGSTVGDEVARYLRFKLAPAPGLVADIVTGKDAVGNPITTLGEIQKYGTFISVNDILDTMKQQDVPAATAIGILSIFGAGVQNFDATKKRHATQ